MYLWFVLSDWYRFDLTPNKITGASKMWNKRKLGATWLAHSIKRHAMHAVEQKTNIYRHSLLFWQQQRTKRPIKNCIIFQFSLCIYDGAMYRTAHDESIASDSPAVLRLHEIAAERVWFTRNRYKRIYSNATLSSYLFFQSFSLNARAPAIRLQSGVIVVYQITRKCLWLPNKQTITELGLWIFPRKRN